MQKLHNVKLVYFAILPKVDSKTFEFWNFDYISRFVIELVKNRKIEITRPVYFREKRFYNLFYPMNFWKTLDTETIEILQKWSIFDCNRFLKRAY